MNADFKVFEFGVQANETQQALKMKTEWGFELKSGLWAVLKGHAHLIVWVGSVVLSGCVWLVVFTTSVGKFLSTINDFEKDSCIQK